MNKVILFDGVCNFCNSSVNYVIKYNDKVGYKFAPLQSSFGEKMISKYNLHNIDSIVLIQYGRAYTKSSAALKIGISLGTYHYLLAPMLLIPKFIRDYFYDLIAQNRYKWFGKKESCMIPSAEIRSYFIEDSPST